MKYWGIHKHNNQHIYRASVKDCRPCPHKSLCTKDRSRSVSFHIYENAILNATQLNKTKEYRISQRKRKLIEELFGEAKEYMGLRVSKFRRMKFVQEQVLMTAATQNIKRMVKLLSNRKPLKEAMAGISSIQLLFAGTIEDLFSLYKIIDKELLEVGNIWAEV